ncbi:MAG: hypothetical protein EON48_09845 [Acetobacteraceae bacterium]|nr:MAG: hypothetical protein EON48_09845 [Acetobacteraceae bacterium]
MDRSLLARSAVQGAWWSFTWRVLAFSVVVQTPFFLARSLAPEVAVLEVVTLTAAFFWVLVRIVVPTWILLGRHYRAVYHLSVPADPALARAIVTGQWAYLRSDLTLPWRAILG